MGKAAELTIGPVLFNWAPEVWRDFYFRMADEAPVDCVYVGEVVCAKRAPFFEPHFEAVLERLRRDGKQVIVSLLAQVASRVDRRLASGMAAMENVMLEVNDASALVSVAGKRHVAGPFLNVYNEDTLCFLAHRGAEIFCLPWELPAQSVTAMCDAAANHNAAIEVNVFGRMPLALSARCYHARAHGLSKDGCQFVCEKDPDGMVLKTLDGTPFLAINGIQTLSHKYLNLLPELDRLAAMGVTRFRLSPDSRDMVQTARLFREVLDQRLGPAEAGFKLVELRPDVGYANGFLHRKPGHEWVAAGPSGGNAVAGQALV
jgi:collagenase-like PrtC family protease